MNFTLKTKITFALSTLLFMLIIIGISALYYINRLTAESKLVLKDNFRSLAYTNDMHTHLGNVQNIILQTQQDNINAQKLADFNIILKKEIKSFEKKLQESKNNITEIGEKDLLAIIEKDYQTYQNLIEIYYTNLTTNQKPITLNTQDFTNIYQILNTNIAKLFDINGKAMQVKNEKLHQTGNNLDVFLKVLGFLGIILVLLVLFLLPNYIINPIKELTTKIKAIENKDYNQKIIIRTNDEVGTLAKAFNAMVLQLKVYEEINLAEILTEKKRTEAVMNALDSGILFLDNKRNTLQANQLAMELIGLDKDMLRNHATVVADKYDFVDEFLRNVETREPQPDSPPIIAFEWHDKQHFFTKKLIEITYKNPFSQKEEKAGFALVLQNVTAFKESDETKSNFLATVSHELKTPIASTKMSIELLENTKIGMLNTEQNELITHIKEDIDRMQRMVSELLKVSQWEAGQIKLNIGLVSVEKIINYAYKAVENIAFQKNISIEINTEKNTPDVIADTEKTAWVLVNLLNNAIRYSPEHSNIEIDVWHEQNTVFVSVTDAGEGINPALRERIFDRFFTTGHEKSFNTGLGLAIARDFIEAQKGKIYLGQKRKEGATFIFTLLGEEV